MRKGPSPEAEAMQNWLLDGIFDAYVELIAAGPEAWSPAKVKRVDRRRARTPPRRRRRPG